MHVLEFIIANWDFILLIVAAIVVLVFSVFKGNKSVVMKMLYALVTEAEKAYGSGTGSMKLATVIGQIYPKLPAIIKVFITEKILAEWVEDALAAAKEAWKKNAALAEYIDSSTSEAAAEAMTTEAAAEAVNNE